MCVTYGEYRRVSSWAAQVGLFFYCTLNQINSKMMAFAFCMIFETIPLISDAIQPSHPLLSPFPPALNLSQHQGLFK